MLTSFELCAGAGGTALGLEQAGFNHVALMDNDSHSCATLRKNRPYWNVIQADIGRFDLAYWHGVDLVSGGLPCPPFSIAGRQLGEDDERDLFPALLRIVDSVSPRAVLVENVRGIMSTRFESYRNHLDHRFDELGFDVFWSMFNAVDFDVPQSRTRVFAVALRRGETVPLRWPSPSNGTALTVGESVGDLMAERGWQLAVEWAAKADAPAPTIVGGSQKHGGPDLGPTRARRQWAKLGVDGLGIANEAPSPSFRGLPRLTTSMVARLQSFPDEWSFSGSKTSQYRQIGNALPVKLAYAIGKAMRKCLV